MQKAFLWKRLFSFLPNPTETTRLLWPPSVLAVEALKSKDLTGFWLESLNLISRPCHDCVMNVQGLASKNSLLLNEQIGFLNSMKKVTSSVTQLSPVVRFLSSVVTPQSPQPLGQERPESVVEAVKDLLALHTQGCNLGLLFQRLTSL